MGTIANYKGAGGPNRSALMRLAKGVSVITPTPAPGKAPKGESLKQKITRGESDLAAGRGISMSFEEFCAK